MWQQYLLIYQLCWCRKRASTHGTCMPCYIACG